MSKKGGKGGKGGKGNPEDIKAEEEKEKFAAKVWSLQSK